MRKYRSANHYQDPQKTNETAPNKVAGQPFLEKNPRCQKGENGGGCGHDAGVDGRGQANAQEEKGNVEGNAKKSQEDDLAKILSFNSGFFEKGD